MSTPVTNKYQSIMAFDFGTKRTGIAMGQRITQTANGIGCISARDGIPNWEQLDKLVEEWQPHAFVVGLPLNMDGSVSEMSRRANKFSNRLCARYARPSFTIDERLSTFAAKEEAEREQDARLETLRKATRRKLGLGSQIFGAASGAGLFDGGGGFSYGDTPIGAGGGSVGGIGTLGPNYGFPSF